jgi:hypothetical protein
VHDVYRDVCTAVGEAVRLTAEMLSKDLPYAVTVKQSNTSFWIDNPAQGRNVGTTTFTIRITDPAAVMHAEAIKALDAAQRSALMQALIQADMFDRAAEAAKQTPTEEEEETRAQVLAHIDAEAAKHATDL